ncbi:hypothetical protein MB27_11775 [Actinoplanes utahensis]|uniref:Uncharacterized protein n=1 Tax=Actinoplanes utahensis TaxID=1869 RepID=A0A0A6XBE5_ACTUT|nr:hypothetical protein MB27_11775 [Actinoplanes utahensis]
MSAVEGADPVRVLRTLRDALAAAGDAVDAAVAGGQVSLTVIAELDDALGRTPTMAAAVQGLLDRADPGQAVAADMRRWSAELAGLSARLAGLRDELNRAAATEDRVREAAAEAEREQQRLDDLRRAERMAGRLDELRDARERLEAEHGALRDRLDAQERAFWPPLDRAIDVLARNAADLQAATADRGRRAAELAGQVVAARTELEQSHEAAAHSSRQIELLRTEITAAAERQRQLAAEMNQLAERHRRHAEADRELAEALNSGGAEEGAVPNIAEARTRLAGIEEQLTEIDRVLRDSLLDAGRRDPLSANQIRPGGRTS